MQILSRRIGTYSKPPQYAAAILNEVERTLRTRVEPGLRKTLDEQVANWEHKPSFAVTWVIKRGDVIVNANPGGRNAKIYRYVDEGTKPHVIRPKRAKALVFRWGGPGSYVPKTTPGNVPGAPPTYGGPGMARGRIRRFAKVNHPGNKPRNLTPLAYSRYRPEFEREITAAINRGAEKAWRSA